MGLSQSIAAHVARVYFADLPAAAVEAAKHSLLDAVGNRRAQSGAGDKKRRPVYAARAWVRVSLASLRFAFAGFAFGVFALARRRCASITASSARRFSEDS